MNLTQSDIAERLNAKGFRFHQSQVAKIERGERPIRVNEWIGIAEALGVASDALMAGGPDTDDALFEARLLYERSRIIVDDAGKALYEAGNQYEFAMSEFVEARERYKEACEEFGETFKEPNMMLVHEAAEHLRRMESTAEYLEVYDKVKDKLQGKLSDIGERALRD